jgi:hypothetical protein
MVDRSQLQRMIDSMERAMTRIEQDQKARHEAEDCECEGELAEGNTFPLARSAQAKNAPRNPTGHVDAYCK